MKDRNNEKNFLKIRKSNLRIVADSSILFLLLIRTNGLKISRLNLFRYLIINRNCMRLFLFWQKNSTRSFILKNHFKKWEIVNVANFNWELMLIPETFDRWSVDFFTEERGQIIAHRLPWPEWKLTKWHPFWQRMALLVTACFWSCPTIVWIRIYILTYVSFILHVN